MQKNIIILALIVFVSCVVLQFFLPWWMPFILFLLVGMFFLKKAVPSFIFGLSVGIAIWLATAIYQDVNSFRPASEVISELLGGVSSPLAYLVTGLLGGILGGMFAMSGTFIAQLKFSE